MTEQLRTLSGIVRDLRATGQDIPEDEQALNVIRALPKTKLWESFSQLWLIATISRLSMPFRSTSKWRMSDKNRLSLQVWHQLPKEVSRRAKDPFVANMPRKVSMPLKALDLGKVWLRSIRLKAMETRV